MLELLRSIGLTDSEAKVYLALLDLGTSTVGPIADKSRASYSKIYLLLEKLIDKGLATYITKEKTRYFTPTSPKKILEYLDQKKTTLDKLSKEVKDMLPKLEAKLKQSQEEEYVTIYEGHEGLKTVYLESINNLKPGDEILVMGATMGAYTQTKQNILLLKKVHTIRQERKIGFRVIFNEEFRQNKDVEFFKKQKPIQVRFLLKNTPAGINIQGNRVLIIYWHKEEPKVFLIQSKIVADSFRKYFEVVWEKAKT
ncbi:hypothetical protein KY348_02340 [Candidatus Woesearchaeota archaeon]|nr:hypothetical protein [Candidatus Woesearchaeota archaeon]